MSTEPAADAAPADAAPADDSGLWGAVVGLAERSWRAPLLLAGILFAVSGPAHALGRVDAVFYAALGGVALGGLGVVLGVLTLDINPAVRRRAGAEREPI